ncbi:hypothetical protein [Halorubrum sp. C191]|uniref:hypothetical protein n=1 Tax=Halorubrum sp. C191 TaxID=1383842 RepID=UPI00130472D5|nr:hypothetical protein [Halorubrum sp. C191]
MTSDLHECPECHQTEVDLENTDYLSHGIDLTFSCRGCGAQFVAALRDAQKEVIDYGK